MSMNCANCGKELPPPPYFRSDTCPHCVADLHVCLQCTFHDPDSYNECRESQAERVVDKEKSNFCDYFSPGDPKSISTGPTKEDALSALDSLFKK
jgi:hypothetical protein